MEGDFVGRYRIRERIGEGGMGLVYAAEDRELGRLVAIKLLRSVEGASAELHRRRLLREAQALARVSHRNLVMVFDVGTHEGRVWIAMERVIGDTLEDWLAAQTRSWQEVVDVFLEAGRGLVAVHEAGLVHRDFKPSNVIVRGDGMVQVLDFGLAAEAGETFDEPRATEEREPQARPDLDALAATLTATGGIMGTPAYMAPEQFLGLGADARSDQFSFCVALYEALYGERPFKGRDLPELMMAVVGGLPDLPPELPDVPDLLRRSLARGLSSEPDARFPDLEALLFALERCRAPAPVERDGGWRRFALGMIAGGAVLAVGVGAWVSTWEDEQTLEPEPEVLLITAPMGEVPDAVVPPDPPEPEPSQESMARKVEASAPRPAPEAPRRPEAEDQAPSEPDRDPAGAMAKADDAPTKNAPAEKSRPGKPTPTGSELPGPVASATASDPSAPEPPSPPPEPPGNPEPPEPSSPASAPDEDDPDHSKAIPAEREPPANDDDQPPAGPAPTAIPEPPPP